MAHEQPFLHLQFKQCFVERPGEKYIQEVLMDQSQAKYPATKPEPVQVVVHERRQRGYLDGGDGNLGQCGEVAEIKVQ